MWVGSHGVHVKVDAQFLQDSSSVYCQEVLISQYSLLFALFSAQSFKCLARWHTRTWDGCFGKSVCTRAPVCVCVFWGLGWFTQPPHSINSRVTAQNSPVCTDVGLKYWADSGAQTEQCWLTDKWRPLSPRLFFSASRSLVLHIYVCVSYWFNLFNLTPIHTPAQTGEQRKSVNADDPPQPQSRRKNRAESRW